MNRTPSAKRRPGGWMNRNSPAKRRPARRHDDAVMFNYIHELVGGPAAQPTPAPAP